ncbi:MAG TPA: aminoacyl-tRNA hydrolase [Lutibacter sp.]|nr:aminoacyl-tRNA hydrolase [Lutibacter sp.]
MKKYLLVGLGNIGAKYENTRHNIGFEVLDTLAKKQEVLFESAKLGAITKFRFKGRVYILLKPSTFMNLSGKAVRYWLTKEKIPTENLLVICDDLSLPIGTLRIKPKGGAGGHNGLQNIQDLLGSSIYPRLRFGIGDKFSKGRQSDFVLGEWKDSERKIINKRIEKAAEAILSFGTAGLNNTMNAYNGNAVT